MNRIPKVGEVVFFTRDDVEYTGHVCSTWSEKRASFATVQTQRGRERWKVDVQDLTTGRERLRQLGE